MYKTFSQNDLFGCLLENNQFCIHKCSKISNIFHLLLSTMVLIIRPLTTTFMYQIIWLIEWWTRQQAEKVLGVGLFSLLHFFFCIRYNQVWCTCRAFEHVHPACYDSHVILFIGAVCYSDKYVIYQRLDTVNFMRILFSWIALKTYLQCLKFTDKAQFTYVSKQQSDFVISRGVYFHQNFAHVKFRGNKTFEKISKFTVTNILVEISTVNVLKIRTHFSSFRIATQYKKIPDFPTFWKPIFTIFIHLTFKIFIQIFMLADLYFKKNLKPLI